MILDSLTIRSPAFAPIPEVLRRSRELKVVLIDMDCDPEMFLGCVRAGAVGYLVKEASATDIISSIKSVASGKAACSPELCMVLFQTVSQQWTSQPSARIKAEFGLTRRQQQLVPLIADGLTNKEIASRLNVSEYTVKSHIHQMLRRVGANGRLEVIDRVRGQNVPAREASHSGESQRLDFAQLDADPVSAVGCETVIRDSDQRSVLRRA